MMVWQLLQARHLPPTPFILYGGHWRGLLSWIEKEALAHGYVEEEDIRLPMQVETVDEAVTIILETLEEFRTRSQTSTRGDS